MAPTPNSVPPFHDQLAVVNFAEADEVGAAMSLPIELAHTFVEQIVGIESRGSKAGTCTHTVEIALSVAAYPLELALGEHKECVGKAEEGKSAELNVLTFTEPSVL